MDEEKRERPWEDMTSLTGVPKGMTRSERYEFAGKLAHALIQRRAPTTPDEAIEGAAEEAETSASEASGPR